MSKASARGFVCIVAASVLFSAQPICAKEKITIASKDARKYPPKPEQCEIQVFEDATTLPTQPYVEVAIINYHDERHRTKDGALKLEVAMPKIAASACKLGADALIGVRVTEVRRLEFAMFNVRAAAVRFETEDQPKSTGAQP